MKLPPALINKVQTLADGTVRLVIDFQEMPPEKMTEIFLEKQNGELVNIEAEQKTDGKTPSLRLRNVLWKLWEQDNDIEGYTAEMHYRDKMSELINHFKSKLN